MPSPFFALCVALGMGLSANTLTKSVVTFNAGGAVFARKIVSGLIAMTLAVWAGYAWIT